ncbi:MAG: hypothetical protein ABW178_04270 [Pseudoxanthomonas sp.]
MRKRDIGQRKIWARRIWIALTIAVACLMLAKPELRALAPLVDAMGMDVLLMLFGLQLLLVGRWISSCLLAPVLHAIGLAMHMLDGWSARMPATASMRRVSGAMLLRLGSTGVAAWLAMHWMLAVLPGE